MTTSRTYDGLGRVVTSQTGTNGPSMSFVYMDKAGTNQTSTQVSQVTDNLGQHAYTYDGNGNIVSISQKVSGASDWTNSYRYGYDSLNQLTRVDDAVQQKTFTYGYDNNGNLQSVKTYAYTTESLEGVTPQDTKTYTYGNANWKDQLTGYNGGTITYDAIGNPLTYYNGAVFTWAEDRKLASYTKGDTSITYQYDGNGRRSEKTVNGTATKYRYIGGSLLGEYTGNKSLTYQYDEAGRCIGFIYNNGTSSQTYYYLYNLQGDVIAIFDTNGNCVAKYSYDAWGKVVSITDGDGTDVSENETHIANVNPLRYRGYYYDAETGLYYVSSRYYDSSAGRFLNADGYIKTPINTLLSMNVFAYCENNPVNKVDTTGDFAIASTLVGAAIGKIGASIIASLAVLVMVDTIVNGPPTIQTLAIPEAKANTKEENKETTDVIASSNSRRDPVHHIVAKADFRAAESRKILRDVGIEPTSN